MRDTVYIDAQGRERTLTTMPTWDFKHKDVTCDTCGASIHAGWYLAHGRGQKATWQCHNCHAQLMVGRLQHKRLVPAGRHVVDAPDGAVLRDYDGWV